MSLPWYSWLIGFGLTLAFELPILWWLLKALEPRPCRRLAIGLLANLATHPLVWFFFPLLPIGYSGILVASELWAFAAETAIYALTTGCTLENVRLGCSEWRVESQTRGGGLSCWWRASLASALANGTSFGLGWIVITRFGRWLF